MLKPKRIFIHHSLTTDGNTLSWPAIGRYHINVKGWSDYGYHAGAEIVNGQIVCLFGRPTTIPGAHARGHNGSSLGFCFVGNYDLDAPSSELLRVAARRVLVPWIRLFGLGLDSIVAHRDFNAAKTCPGILFNMDRLRGIVWEEMNVGS